MPIPDTPYGMPRMGVGIETEASLTRKESSLGLEEDPGYGWTYDFQTPKAEERDTDTRGTKPITEDYPLYGRRWGIKLRPKDVPADIRVHDTQSESEAIECKVQYNKVHYKKRTTRSAPSAINRLQQIESDSEIEDGIQAHYRRVGLSMFDPRFFTLKANHTSEAGRRIELATRKLREMTASSWTLRSPTNETSYSNPDLRYTKDVVLPNLALITDILWGTDRGHCSQIRYAGRGRHLAPHPDLVFEDGHGRIRSEGYGKWYGPDLYTALAEPGAALKQAPDLELMGWKAIRVPIVVNAREAMDMRSGPWRRKYNQVPRLLRHMDLVVRNHPATNRVFGLAISGTCLRLWTADAGSFSSSRLYRLDNPTHARQIVEIIAFISQPQSPHFQTWSPTSPLTIRSQTFGSTYEHIHTSQQYIHSSTKMLEVRQWLFGSRTIVWATTPMSGLEGSIDEDSAHRQEVCKPNSSKQVDAQPNRDGESSSRVPEREGEGTLTRDKKGKRKATEADLSSDTDEELDRPSASRNRREGPLPASHEAQVREGDQIVLKGTWQYKELKRHEERVLRRLHGGERPGREDLGGLHVEDHIDRDVLRHLPRLLGLVDEDRFADWITHENTLHSLSQDPDHAEKTRLHFSVLAVTCPLGQRLPAVAKDSPIGLRQYAQILLGGIQTDWLSASKGIHYRDNNPGNLMWKQLATFSDGRSLPDVVGYLVDFGNARILEQAHLTFDWMTNTTLALSLCADDGRSANPWFQSISSMEAEKIRRDCEQAIARRLTAGTPGSAKRKAEQETLWASYMADWETQALQLKHRYLDDVESLLYLVSYDIWAVHIPNNDESNTQLNQLEYKQAAWEDKLWQLRVGIDSDE